MQNTGRWFYTFVLISLVVAGVASMRSDTAAPVRPLRVVFLGRISPTVDTTYKRLAKELQTLPDSLRARLQFQFVPALLADRYRIEEGTSEAIEKRPDVILAPSTTTARAVRLRQSGIPLIFVSFQDPVQNQVVTSVEQRTEPMTGVWIADDLDEKRLEVLRDAYPHIRSVAVLMDRSWAEDRDSESRLQAHAQRLSLRLKIFYADDAAEVQSLLGGMNADDFDAWCLPPTGLAYLNTRTILDRLRSWHKPVITGDSADVSVGAALSYGVDDSFRWPALADLLTRVLQGEPAGDIPIQRPQRYVLAVQAKPAPGIEAPSLNVQQRADLLLR